MPSGSWALSGGFLGGDKGETAPRDDDPGSPFPWVTEHVGTVAVLGKGARGTGCRVGGERSPR